MSKSNETSDVHDGAPVRLPLHDPPGETDCLGPRWVRQEEHRRKARKNKSLARSNKTWMGMLR